MSCSSLKLDGPPALATGLCFAFAIMLFLSHVKAVPIDTSTQDKVLVVPKGNSEQPGSQDFGNNPISTPLSQNKKISSETQSMILDTMIDAGSSSNFPYFSKYLSSRYGCMAVTPNSTNKNGSDDVPDGGQRARPKLDAAQDRAGLAPLNGIQYPYDTDIDYGSYGKRLSK